MPKKKATGGKKKAAAPAPAPAPGKPEPVVASAPKGGDAGQAAMMDAAASKLKAQDPAEAEAKQAQRERAAKLAKVKLNPEDVDFYVNNCCCPKDQAEKALRETEGDLKAALLAFAQG